MAKKNTKPQEPEIVELDLEAEIAHLLKEEEENEQK